MRLTVNGERFDLTVGDTLGALLGELQADPDRVAVLVNDEVVPAAQRRTRKLFEHDRVEVLAFAGGG